MKKLRERISVFIVMNPARAIMIGIVVLNIVLFFASASVIYLLAPENMAGSGFWACMYYTVSMVLDAGNAQSVIEDIGSASLALIITCLLTVLIGMITFTGAVIGYMTNSISGFIENSEAGKRSVRVSGHTVSS